MKQLSATFADLIIHSLLQEPFYAEIKLHLLTMWLPSLTSDKAQSVLTVFA